MADQSHPSTISIIVTIVGASGLPAQSILKRSPNVFVQLRAGKSPSRQTAVVKRSTAPSWETAFPFVGLDESSELSFKVVHKGRAGNTSLGHIVIKTKELLTLQQNKEHVLLELPIGYIMVRVRQETDSSVAGAALAQKLSVQGGPVIPDISDSTNVFQSLGAVVQALEKLMTIADSLVKIHPYVNAAWQVVSSVYKVVQRQLDRDEKIRGLVSTMKTLYSFVHQVDLLAEKHRSLEIVVQQILQQTVECALFIQEYAGHGFAGKAIRHSVSTADAKIEEFQTSFVNLQRFLDTGLGVHVSLVSFRTYEAVERLVIHTTLEPVTMDWSKRQLCQPDTRLDTIKFITQWVINASGDNSNILWLWGLAGAGKSTLATTIANFFNDIHRLGAFIFFDRDVKERSDPFAVIRTLAYQLGSFDSRIGHEVSHAINRNSQIAKMQLPAQFRELLRQPLESAAGLSEEGPIVIVIDALDECGTANDRGRLLALLAEETEHLPRAVRIVITSRPEHDIKSALRSQRHIHARELEISANHPDISCFIKNEMAKISRRHDLPGDWPGDGKISALVQRAAGLFIWASTACKYIDGYGPEERLDDLVLGNVYQDAESALDALYVKSLESSGDWKDARFRSDCCAILGLILVAKDPLSPTAINNLLSVKSRPAISTLGSILHWEGLTDPVRILHLSFRDFLSNRVRCQNGPWFIDLEDHNQRLVACSMKCLTSAFGEDFCRLKLDEPRTNQALDEDITYACTYWMVHVCEIATCPEGFGHQLYEFLSNHVLHWLEAMSILGTSRTTTSMLERLHTWVIDLVPGDANLHELTYDAYRFAMFFSNTIAQHPSLVYQSALPFAPVNSTIYKLFHHRGLPCVLGGFQEWWSPCLQVLPGYDHAEVNSLAFSPDGSKMVSIQSSSLIQIWDVTTGSEAVPELRADGAKFVTFSPDGSKFQSGSTSGKIQTWDATTGRELSPALEWDQWVLDSDSPHNFFNCVAFSPDGLRAAFGADDGTVHIINMVTGKGVYPALKARVAITALSFSSDGLQIASGSGDGKVRIWDVETGQEASPSLQTSPSSSEVTSLKFSADGSKVMSGSENNLIRTWDLTTGQTECITLHDDAGKVREIVTFSPDGSRVASSSASGSIQIWDSETGEKVGSELQGHWFLVSSAAFSPDGTRLVSGTSSDNVRIWDTSPSRKSNSKVQRHTDAPYGVAFSPDGLRIRSNSADGIRFWDTVSGRALKAEDPHVDSMIFAPDSSNVVFKDLGKLVVLLDAETGKELQPEPADSYWVSSLSSCSSGSNTLSFSKSDGEVRGLNGDNFVWRIPSELRTWVHDFRGRYIAVGITTGQVFVVYLPPP